MNFDKYTDRLKSSIQKSQALAYRLSQQKLSPQHLLKALLEDDGCNSLLRESGGRLADLERLLAESFKKIPTVEGSAANQLYLDSDLQQIFVMAEEIARQAQEEYVSSDRALQAMLNIGKDKEISNILLKAGVNLDKLTELITKRHQAKNVDSPQAEEGFDALKKYTTDLTAKARAGKLDPVIGRDEEIRRAIQVLTRRTKNNPVLIGEAGVGKTAIAEGLSWRIVNGDVPENLRHTRLLSLDLGSLIAGAKFRGEFEERLKACLEEITNSKQDIVLFIDELHTLMGAGKAEGAMDAANMLKPALARGQLHCIGATTLDEYRQHIEKDAALARRFQPVFIKEPTVEEAISILRGLKDKYELHHGVRIKDDAIIAAANLSNRYIGERFLPDKAIDLMDEAASRLRMTVDSKPEQLDEIDRKIMQLRIELEALQKEKSNPERIVNIEKNLYNLQEKSRELTGAWQAAQQKRQEVQSLKEKLEKSRFEFEEAQRKGDWAKAGEIKYSLIPEIEKQLNAFDGEQLNSLVQQEVTVDDIAAIVAKWTGIPVESLLAGEREKLLNMRDKLARSVVGQPEAITAISEAVLRSRAGLSDTNRPIGSFLFLGPTGVGKTELAKSLARFLFDDKQALLRIDMSEYMERHTVSRLIGAPPGYVGYEEGGSLTEAVRRRPYQVILFDEVEKAHNDVFNVLLQVLDDGRLTDGQGRTVDFRNTLIILTSNLGSEFLGNVEEGNEISDAVREQVMNQVRRTFRPEFINRLDDILLFRRLGRAHMREIVDLQLNLLMAKLQEQGIELKVTDEAKDWLGEKGYDPTYGARPLKRVIQKYVQDKIANLIISGTVTSGTKIMVEKDQNNPDGLSFANLQTS